MIMINIHVYVVYELIAELASHLSLITDDLSVIIEEEYAGKPQGGGEKVFAICRGQGD